jgi:iron complex outermembrane receptor protein
MFGEPLPGLKLLGGFTLLDAKLLNAQNPAVIGNQAVGTAPFQLAFTAEYDTPWVEGLGMLGRVIHVGEVNLNQANTQAAPPYTRVDAGLSYTFERPGSLPPVTLRAQVNNLFNANYWIATNAFFAQNQPRTLYLTLSADF